MKMILDAKQLIAKGVGTSFGCTQRDIFRWAHWFLFNFPFSKLPLIQFGLYVFTRNNEICRSKNTRWRLDFPFSQCVNAIVLIAASPLPQVSHLSHESYANKMEVLCNNCMPFAFGKHLSNGNHNKNFIAI